MRTGILLQGLPPRTQLGFPVQQPTAGICGAPSGAPRSARAPDRPGVGGGRGLLPPTDKPATGRIYFDLSVFLE